MADSRLTPLQRDVLDAFFRRERRFFLSGGAALAGFHLGHRDTHDLDLFTTEDSLDQGVSTLAQVAEGLGCSIERIQTSPDFRRHLLRRGIEAVVVDLVRERVPQIVLEKPIIDGIRVDPPEEILANKLCALLSRSELRDIVDVRALEGAGFALEPALVAGARKDGGLTAAQLAWVLSQVSIGDDASPPGGVTPMALRDYLKGLISRLVQLGLPRAPGI